MIRAVFMGKDGSCGFRKDRNYELKSFIKPASEAYGELIVIKDVKDGHSCGYSSLEAFLENWMVLQINGRWY